MHLDELPVKRDNTFGETADESLEGLLGEIKGTLSAVLGGAGIDNLEVNRLATVGDANHLAALGVRALEGTHLLLVHGDNHIVLVEFNIAGARVVREPGSTAMEGLAGIVTAAVIAVTAVATLAQGGRGGGTMTNGGSSQDNGGTKGGNEEEDVRLEHIESC